MPVTVITAAIDLADGAEQRHRNARGPTSHAPTGTCPTAPTASMITFVTASGCETMITWEPSSSLIVAPARSGIERTTPALAALSPDATTVHEGRSLPCGVGLPARRAVKRWQATPRSAS